MQQVGARGFAIAQAVDPRQFPAPLNGLTRRANINFGHAWVLHKRLIVRAVAAGLVLCAVVGAYEGREALVAGGLTAWDMAQGEASKLGFGIAKIAITGQSLTSERDIVKALGIGPTTSTLNFDADAARAKLLAMPTIKSATVRKIYPGELSVSIEEKIPMARWRIGDTTYLVAEDGSPVAPDLGGFAELPLVVGEGAADDAMVMIKALDRYPALKDDLAALSRVGDRRWDLIFYTGLRVQLPELGVAQALAQLDRYQADYQLLDRDVTIIDMRVANMVALAPGELTIAQLAADKKKNKHVVKGEAEYETAAERAAESKAQ